METYKITRYEEKSDALFICINHTEKPVYIEHFFTEDERKNEESIKDTIAGLIAELEIKADEYVEPEESVSNLEYAKNLTISNSKITAKKAELITKRI